MATQAQLATTKIIRKPNQPSPLIGSNKFSLLEACRRLLGIVQTEPEACGIYSATIKACEEAYLSELSLIGENRT